MTQTLKMKCPHCTFINQHDGIYCTDCGSNFLEITYPNVCYFIRGTITLISRIRNPFHGNILLKQILVDDKPIDKKIRIGYGKTKDETSIDHDSRKIIEPNLTFVLEKDEEEYVIPNIIRPFSLSPIPEISIEPVEHGETLFMSPTTGFEKQFKVKLNNNAIVNIDGIYLIKGEDADFDPFKKNQPRTFWTHFLPVIEKNVELRPPSPGYSDEPIEATITVDFSPLKDDVLDQEFYLSIRNVYGANEEIYHESDKIKVRLEYRNLVPLALGIYHSSDKGFVFIADNHVYRNNPEKDEDDLVLSGQQIQDSIHIVNWREKFSDDRGVEERLTDFNTRKIKFNIPVAKKRKRQFTLYQNYLQEFSGNYDLEHNESYLIIKPSGECNVENLSPEILSYKELENDGKVSNVVFMGNELRLADIREFNAFEVIFNFPADCANTEYVFELSILRKNRSTAMIVDKLNYKLIVKTYLPKPLPRNEFIAIDFGTSNTCVVGPPILHGEIFEGDPVWYPLNHYHEISGQISTFPTRIAYEELVDSKIGDHYIPDSIKLANIRYLFEKFKIKLPDELAEESEIQNENANEKNSLKFTIEFIFSILSNLEIYFEDKNCLENIFSNIKLTAPTGFMPEIREKVVIALKDYLSKNDPYKSDYTILMDLDEPEAVIIYAYSTNTNDRVDFEDHPGQMELLGVYDFGGGTTDTSFILIDDESSTMIGTGGSVRVGGTTVDRWLVKRFTMAGELSDSINAKDFNLSEDNNELRSSKVENQFVKNPQFSLEVSKIKHKFKVKLDESINIPQELLDQFSLDRAGIFLEDENYEEIQEQIRSVILNSKAYEKMDVDFWQTRSNIFIHLLIPFYASLFRKMSEIMTDTLKESFEESGILPEPLVNKINVTLLLAGNASRIAYMKTLLGDILNRAKQVYPFIGNIKLRLLENPKEAVGFGAYYATQAGEANIQKLNNPPMVVFTKVGPLFRSKDIKNIGNERGIIIFNEGDKSKNPDWGDVLVKVCAAKEVGSGPGKQQIAISKKIGIDHLSSQQKIKGFSTGDYLAFVLTVTNRLEIFRFSNAEELMKTEDFINAIKGGHVNMKYIKSQFKI